MTTSSSLGQMEQFKDCFKWDNVCEGIRCSGEQTGLFNKCYCSIPLPARNLRSGCKATSLWSVGKCSAYPIKIKFHGWREIKDFRVISSQRDSMCGPFLLLLWHFLALSLALPPWQLTADSLTLFLRGQKLSECMFIHLANVLFPLCLSQPKHAINGRHQPKIFSVRLPQVPSHLP